jgi:serine protease Do
MLFTLADVRAQGTLSAMDAEVDHLVRSTRPSVVTVIARSEVLRKSTPRGKPQRRLYTRVGSGFAVGSQEILTTASVVLDAEHVWVRTSNELQVEARVAGIDPVSNLALLKVTDVRLPSIRLATSAPDRAGEWTLALGTVRYHRERITQSVGTVAFRHSEPRLPLTQLTNWVQPGYSGGPVVNARGELIGVLQGELGQDRALTASGDRGAGSFMLPIESVRPVLQALQTAGRVRHGYLGISTRAASVESDTQEGLRVPIGALLESAVPNGPAAGLGLRHGDLIVAFEGARVEYPTQLARWVSATPPGTAVDLVWVRNEEQQSGRVVLTESPDARPEWALSSSSPAPDGARISDLERQIQKLNRELARLKNGSEGDAR